MSARRWWIRSLLAAALVAGATGLARAQTVVARIGGQLLARPGQSIDVPVTVDLSGAPGVSLGSYRGAIRFDPSALEVGSVLPGTFAAPLVNTDSSSYGVVRFTAILPAGAPGPVVTLFIVRFYMPNPDTASASLTLSFDEMSAAGMPFTNLLPLLQPIQPATVCPSLGFWGDVDLDGNANSRDALIALSRVVGIALDTTYTDPTYNLTYVIMRPGLADVDGDGHVTSRDALIIMSYAVGLPVSGYRIGRAAAGGVCGAGTGVVLRITPDTLELQGMQTFNLTVTARDSAGTPVAASDIRWSSSNPAVASLLVDYTGAFRVFARDSGWAVISAEVGVGYRASAVVHVIAHRTQWYVDIVRAGQTSYEQQAGDRRLPFAYIQDALNAARDLDTINVAPGIYPEAVSSDLSVFLRGDSLNRPVIDPRGAQYYNEGPALNLGSRVGLLRIENFRVVGGGIEAYAHSFVGRNLRIDSLISGEGSYPSLYFRSTPSMPPGGVPPAGVQLGDMPYDTGSVYLDGIDVRGSVDRGIWIETADSVVIQHATVQGDTANPSYSYCYTSPGAYGGIVVDEAAHTLVASNTVTDAKCAGIAVFQTGGQVAVTGNRVARVGGIGILVSAPQVAFDHNAVRDVRSPDYYYGPWDGRQSAGIRVSNWHAVDSVTSLADTVRHVGGSGFLVDTLRTAVLDSLVVDSTGVIWTDVSPAAFSHGAALYAGRYTVQHARISNTQNDALSVCGSTAALFSRGNYITNSGYNGILTSDCYVVEGSGDGPDTLVSVKDTVDIPSTNSSAGIYAGAARYARVDSAVVSGTGTDGALGIGFDYVDTVVLRDSKVSNLGYDGVDVYGVSGSSHALFERDSIASVGGTGVYLDSVDSTVIRDSKISSTGWEGIYLWSGTAVLFERDTIASAGYEGLYLEYIADTARVRQTVVTNSGSSGIYLYGNTVIRADTIAVTGSLNVSSGLSFDGGSAGRVTGSRLEGNSNYGVHVYYWNPQGFVTLDSLNSLAGNAHGGVNYQSDGGPQLYAERNWWGSPTGPTQGSGDSLDVLGDVDYANPLPARPSFPSWIAAPPAQLAAAVRPVASAAVGAEGTVERRRPDRLARHTNTSRAAAPRAARSALQPTALPPARRPTAAIARATGTRPPLMTYRKGAPPRPATVHHP